MFRPFNSSHVTVLSSRRAILKTSKLMYKQGPLQNIIPGTHWLGNRLIISNVPISFF